MLMDYEQKIILLNFSISKIKGMLKSQEIYNKKMRMDIYEELDLIKNKQLDFICDDHLEFVTNEHLDLITGKESVLITEEQLKFDTGKIQYRIKKRRNRLEILIKEAKYNDSQIIDILTIEFPEYKVSSHNTLLSDLKNPRYYKSEGFKKLTIMDPITTILSFK